MPGSRDYQLHRKSDRVHYSMGEYQTRSTMLQPLGVHKLCRDIHKLRNLYSIQSPIVKFLNHEITTKVLNSPRIESLLLYSE